MLKGDNIYFIGIGGIGMSALARFFVAEGKTVSGYDKTPSPLTQSLKDEGIDIIFDDNPNLISQMPDIVIYTPAIPKDNLIYNHLNSKKIPFYKRSEILGEISKEFFTIAVAGTHGKTTITSLISHILKYNNLPVTGFVGGICKNYKSNLILSEKSKILVVEADEYDRSFLTLHPDIAIISSMDADHLDIYGSQDFLKESFFLFSQQIKKGGFLIIKKGLSVAPNLNINVQEYSVEGNTLIEAKNIAIKKGQTHFTLNINGSYSENYTTFLPGIHNVENITAAAAAAYRLGINNLELSKAISTYTGVARRFDIKIKKSGRIYIDDYAHHPAEITATLKAVRNLHPDKKITVVFQPHLYSRTRDFGNDFGNADEVLLMDIYPAREKPIKGITAKWLLDKINCNNKRIVDFDNVIEIVSNLNPELILTLGAGDIDRIVEPLKKALS